MVMKRESSRIYFHKFYLDASLWGNFLSFCVYGGGAGEIPVSQSKDRAKMQRSPQPSLGTLKTLVSSHFICCDNYCDCHFYYRFEH